MECLLEQGHLAMTLHAAKLPFRRPARSRAPPQLLVARAPVRHTARLRLQPRHVALDQVRGLDSHAEAFSSRSSRWRRSSARVASASLSRVCHWPRGTGTSPHTARTAARRPCAPSSTTSSGQSQNPRLPSFERSANGTNVKVDRAPTLSGPPRGDKNNRRRYSSAEFPVISGRFRERRPGLELAPRC